MKTINEILGLDKSEEERQREAKARAAYINRCLMKAAFSHQIIPPEIPKDIELKDIKYPNIIDVGCSSTEDEK